jgi:hypothetical protein
MTDHNDDDFERVEPPVEVQIDQPSVQVLSIPHGKLEEATEALRPLLADHPIPETAGTGCRYTKKGDLWCADTVAQ